MSSQVKLTPTANFVTHRKVKARDIYSSYLLMAGIVCFVLGIGNWIVGAVETSKYQNLLHRTEQTGLEESYRSFQELDHQKNEEVLRRINEDREKYNAARVKTQLLLRGFDGRKNVVSVRSPADVVVPDSSHPPRCAEKNEHTDRPS